MLHILWILIKFILILLGILLGLVLLALLLVLFCPVRYSASAIKENGSFKEIQAKARVSWLFRAVGASFFFRNGETKLVITLFGIPLDKIQGFLNSLKNRHRGQAGAGGKSEKKKTSSKNEEGVQLFGEEFPEEPEEETLEEIWTAKEAAKDQKKSPTVEELKKTQAAEDLEMSQPFREPVAGNDATPQNLSQHPEKQVPEKDKNSFLNVLFIRIREILNKILNFPGNLWKRITSFIKSIQENFRHIKQTFSRIKNRIDWWKEFLGNERIKAAFALVYKDAKGLIRHVLPTKIDGHVTFGCEDPAVTGIALVVLGMTFPFHKNKVQVTPLFDGENQLTGDIAMKGRIYGIMFVKAAIEIYFNKNIKYVMNRWKHKED